MLLAFALCAALITGVLAGLVATRRALARPGDARTQTSGTESADSLRLRSVEELLDSMALGVVVFDAALHVCYANAAAAELLEANRAPLAGRSAAELLRDYDAHLALSEAVRTGERREAVLRSTSGRLQLHATITPVAGPGSWRALVALLDVTEARRMESVRRDFVSNVSHELRTPLASVKAVVDVLLDGALADGEAASQFVESISAETDRMIHLVEELMELTRIESGQVPFKLLHHSPRSLLEDASARMAAQAERKHIELLVEADQALPEIAADFDRLVRALLNLVQNSIKFTDEGGTITLSAHRQGDGVALAVTDTGIGIAAGDVQRVFERFYKVDRARGSSGTGLGLSIVKHTVEAHGGAVSATSTLGKGSTFTMLLPAADL